MVLSIQNITKSFIVDKIIDDINFNVENGEKLAIVGVNGAGKTTLMRIITGEMTADSGEVVIPQGIQIGYMAQLAELTNEHTIKEELTTVFADIIEIEENIQILAKSMAHLEGKDLETTMSKYERLNFELESKNGYEYKSRIRGVIAGLGFTEDADKKIGILSGGQKTRISLGKLLLSSPDLLLLDEPTNHLDIESINWFEDFVRNYPKTVIIISHDRYFLDKTVTKVFEIENTHGAMYFGNYSYYAAQKEVLRQNSLKKYLDQQKIIKKQEESIKLLRSFNREKQVKRAESKQKQLDKIDRVKHPERLPDKIRIDLSPKIQSGNDVLFVKNISKSFGQNHLFSNVSFEIKRGEKVALIGPNGIGKTTIFNIILDHLQADTGKVVLGHNVKCGYYDQGQQGLNDNKNIVEEISDAYPSLTIGEIRNVLAAFVFTDDDVFKKISSLSGGEKGRVSLAKIMLSSTNLLLLDEPTNHLDMFSKEVLEDALADFSGTIIFISHDRYFINTTATKIIELSNAGVTIYDGDYDYYIEKSTENKEAAVKNATSENDAVKNEWLLKKQNEANIRKQKNRVKKMKSEIEKTEQLIEKLTTDLENSEISADHEKIAQIYEEKEKAEALLLELYEEFEEYAQ